MALSGSLSTNNEESHGYGTLGLILSWTATQSIANNTSTIKWTLKSKGTMSSGYWYYCYGVEVKINGSKVYGTSSKFEMRGDGGFKKTGTITVAHTADGSKNVAMSVRAKIYDNSWNCTKSGTFTLNKINRYALLGEVTNFTDETYPSIVYTNPAGTDLVDDLQVRITWNGGADATEYYSDLNDAGGSYTFDNTTLTPADISSMLASCPTSNTLPIQFDLMSTLNGVQYHSYKSATMEVVNANPIPGAVSYLDTNAGVVAITGSDQVIVQLHSTLEIQTLESTPQKSASIVSYNLNINGNDYTPTWSGGSPDVGSVDFVKPNVAGTYTATVTTTDSRGNTATESVDITILGWSQPSALYSFERVQNFVTNQAILHVDGNISDIPGSSLLITETHREKDTGAWSDPATVPDNDDFTISNLDYQKEYELIITVSDSFTRADSPPTNQTYQVGIGKGIPLVFFDTFRHSVAVNGIADDDDQLFVGGTIKSTGKITAPSMSVTDISNQYALAKTSGNWKLNEIEAVRSGSTIHIRIAMSGNGSSVSAGSNGFVGTLSGGPLPSLSIKLIAYYNNCPIMMNIEPDGSVTARVTATSVTVTTTGTLALTGTFITND